jgi:hypothetical protein
MVLPKYLRNMDSTNAILTTIVYSDLFAFPLIKEEIFRYLITAKPVTKSEFAKALETVVTARHPSVVTYDGFYCLVGREEIITERKKNQPEVIKKMLIAKKAARALSSIPTILCIGISGSLGAGQAHASDDIDFFIITKKGTLFTTRLIVLGLLEFLGIRRKRKDTDPANKICSNLFIDETSLSWPTSRQDIYTAHEIAQLQPLFQREDSYHKFFAHNHWIHAFLPHATPYPLIVHHVPALPLLTPLLRPTEWIAATVQKTLMKQHQTNETVRKDFLALHPNDYRSKTLHLLRLKCRKLGLLTKF